jgi:hypothetical protein
MSNTNTASPELPGLEIRTHELKTDPEVFVAVVAGKKTHEIRLNDRGFQVGEDLLLRETVSSGAEMKAGAPLVYTGRATVRTVSHIQTGYGLADGWCILSFARFDHAPALAEKAEAPATEELVHALRQAERLLRAAGFAMTGTASSQIVAAISAHSKAAQLDGAQGEGK